MADPPRSDWRPSPFLSATAGLHGVALAAAIASPGWRGLALGAVVANHLAITAAVLLPRCSWLGPNLRRIPDERARGTFVSLTFDDGPDPEITPAVLDLLDGAGAKATFFCLGSRAEKYPDLVAAIRARGHGVENHSQEHPWSFALMSPRRMRNEIVRAQEAIERAGGGRPRFFRAPAGIQNPWLFPLLHHLDLSLVSWTRRGFDTVTGDGSRVAQRLQRALQAGDILVMHDGRSARDRAGRPVVLEALSRVLESLARKNLRSLPLHELL